MYTFYIKTKLFGPYLPKEHQVLYNYSFIEEVVADNDWIEGPPDLKADPSEGSSGLIIKEVLEIKNPCIIFVKVEINSTSARLAYKEAEKQVHALISFLSIATIASRYYYSFHGAKMIPKDGKTFPHESPMCNPVFGLSVKKNAVVPEQLKYIQQLGTQLDEDQTLSISIGYFAKALAAEFKESVTDEKAVLFYYKIIELISGKFATKTKPTQAEKEKQLDEIASTLLNKLTGNSNIRDKEVALRVACSELRKLDGSIMSKKILDTATSFNFSSVGKAKLQKLITARNKIIVHPDTNPNIELDDKRDFREMAKIFIRHYCQHFLGIDFTKLESIPQVKEIGGWYLVTYNRSSN